MKNNNYTLNDTNSNFTGADHQSADRFFSKAAEHLRGRKVGATENLVDDHCADRSFSKAAEHLRGRTVGANGTPLVATGEPSDDCSTDRSFTKAAEHLSGGPVGATRIISFDLARGFTVLLMPSIHVAMLYSKPGVQQSMLGAVLGFIAEGPGAQLFMLLMGVSFVFSRGISRRRVIRRTLFFIIAAYTLNFLKFIVPLLVGGMPLKLLEELGLETDSQAISFFMSIGDILHFAAIAYPLLFVLTRIKHYPWLAAVLAIFIIFISPLLWDRQTGFEGIDQLLLLFNGHPPQTFFPVLPWLVYPLAGLTLGYCLKRYDQAMIIKRMGLLGAFLIIGSLLLPASTDPVPYLLFYRTGPADTIFHLGFVGLWLALVSWIQKKSRPNYFFELLSFCSKHITLIYLIQWILICWCLPFTGYMELGMLETITGMAAITVTTLVITAYIATLKKS